jgi:hypothetical protein
VRWWLVISLRLDVVLPVGGGVSESPARVGSSVLRWLLLFTLTGST